MTFTIHTKEHVVISHSPKAYISGPITGMPNLNRIGFEAAEEALRNCHFRPVNPHKLYPSSVNGNPFIPTWNECMKEDLTEMYKCGLVCMIGGWKDSNEAIWEFMNAVRLGIPVLDITNLTLSPPQPGAVNPENRNKLNLKSLPVEFIFCDKKLWQELSDKVTANLFPEQEKNFSTC